MESKHLLPKQQHKIYRKKRTQQNCIKQTSTTSFNIWERLELFLLSASWISPRGNSIYNIEHGVGSHTLEQ